MPGQEALSVVMASGGGDAGRSSSPGHSVWHSALSGGSSLGRSGVRLGFWPFLREAGWSGCQERGPVLCDFGLVT